MFMRFRGGGVGHKSIREQTKCFLKDRWPEELEKKVEKIENKEIELDFMDEENDEELSDHHSEDSSENGLENAEDDDDDDDDDDGYATL
jgi:hypothetical protein